MLPGAVVRPLPAAVGDRVVLSDTGSLGAVLAYDQTGDRLCSLAPSRPRLDAQSQRAMKNRGGGRFNILSWLGHGARHVRFSVLDAAHECDPMDCEHEDGWAAACCNHTIGAAKASGRHGTVPPPWGLMQAISRPPRSLGSVFSTGWRSGDSQCRPRLPVGAAPHGTSTRWVASGELR